MSLGRACPVNPLENTLLQESPSSAGVCVRGSFTNLEDVVEGGVGEAGLHGGEHVVGLLALRGLGAQRLRVANQRAVRVVADLLEVLLHLLHLADVAEIIFNVRYINVKFCKISKSEILQGISKSEILLDIKERNSARYQ